MACSRCQHDAASDFHEAQCYLSYSNRHAVLLFELISRRDQNNGTIVTSNRPFAEWHEVFPNAACVVSLVDRLAHLAEVISIAGGSYRLKEARKWADERRPPARSRLRQLGKRKASSHESPVVAFQSNARLELRRANGP